MSFPPGHAVNDGIPANSDEPYTVLLPTIILVEDAILCEAD
jgi:hypothetical protein